MSVSDTDAVESVEDLAVRNPKTDLSQIREVQVLLGELRKAGLTGSTYDLVSPYDRRSTPSGAPRGVHRLLPAKDR